MIGIMIWSLKIPREDTLIRSTQSSGNNSKENLRAPKLQREAHSRRVSKAKLCNVRKDSSDQ